MPGPAGLFAAWRLAELGYEPLLLERGKTVEQRRLDTAAFWKRGDLDPESNVLFGEGGAGAFSDGKLTTRIKDPRRREVLRVLAECGAPSSIVFDARPHVGTNRLPYILQELRRRLIESGCEILTDGWCGYNDLPKHGYKHSKTVLSETGDPAHVAMPGVHRIASLMKRWLLCTHQGAVSGKHLDYYLDEYTFRFNRRTSGSRGMLFYRLMQQAVTTASLPYRQIVDGNHTM